ncbi:retinal-binding protein-like isoform X2 [Argiope bruennichi]|uniref:retinal-binding protein-like isoform X2 n=1 Tax=Argiope bruennichi TaxID=94029 RepID=UPI0024940D15|nr:retinal-binding protein-like isoform X2 [Argiope bruennichi]
MLHILRDFLMPPVLGYDKDGCPVRLVQVGYQDIKGALCCVRPSELPKYIVWFLDTDKEEMRKRSRETGIHIDKRTFIIDLDGLNLMHIYRRDVYEMALASLKLYENNYPENLKVAFIINTPSFFHYLFNMFKPLLSESTCERVKIYGNSGWKEAILEHIDADLLPVVYGGTRTDPDGDPNCPSLVKILNPIPTELYLKNMNTLSEDDENVRKITVHSRSKCSIHLKVDVPGSTVGWEVECEKNDIKIYLVHTEGSKYEVVVTPVTVYSDFGSEAGCYLAENTGIYSLVLDNTYSIFTAKQVLCKFYVSTVTSKMSHVFKPILSENNNS